MQDGIDYLDRLEEQEKQTVWDLRMQKVWEVQYDAMPDSDRQHICFDCRRHLADFTSAAPLPFAERYYCWECLERYVARALG